MRHADRGMTLIEILVVLIVIALLATAAAIGIGGLRGAKLEDQALRLSRMSRSALIYALTHATNVRLTIDIDGRTVTAEEASWVALVDETGRMVETDAGDAGEDAEPSGLDEPPPGPRGEEGEAMGEGEGLGGGLFGGMGLGMFGGSSALGEILEPPRYTAPTFVPIDDRRLQPIKLDRAGTVRVYLPEMEEPIEEGRVYLLFNEDGTTDGAVVHLEDSEGRIFAVAIDRLTGRGAVYPFPYLPEPVEITP